MFESSGGDAGVSGGQIHNAEFVFPGESLEIAEFRENNTNRPLMAIQIYGNGDCKGAGTPGNPLYLTVDTKDDDKECSSTFKLKQLMPGGVLGIMDKSLMPSIDQSVLNLSSYTVPGV